MAPTAARASVSPVIITTGISGQRSRTCRSTCRPSRWGMCRSHSRTSVASGLAPIDVRADAADENVRTLYDVFCSAVPSASASTSSSSTITTRPESER